jgi:hypothetical protein
LSPTKARLCWDRRGILAAHISGTAVLEYGPTEILPPVAAKWKALRISADPVGSVTHWPREHLMDEHIGRFNADADKPEPAAEPWRGTGSSNPPSSSRESTTNRENRVPLRENRADDDKAIA